jgi:transglutaminase-like putative cysteine protease
VAFIAYVGLATLALTVGHLRRLAQRHRTQEIPIPRAFYLTTVSLSGVTLLFSVVVFVVFPRVSRGWAGRGEPVATSMAGFADEVSLGSHGSRIYGNPQIVLRVEFPGDPPGNFQSLYWRGRSYDHFDGVRWSRSERIPPSLAPSAWYAAWGKNLLEQRIYAAPLDVRVLFALHPTVDIETHSGIQPIADNVGDLSYWGSASPSYTVWSILGRPGSDALRGAEDDFVPARAFYLQVPPISDDVRSLADSLLADRPTAYDKAQALVDWFRTDFAYTLELPSSPGDATLDHFLLDRRAGHCEYFSTAMAILLRTQGVATREVNGFLGGEWSQFGDYLAVTQNQAHAWVEVWFPGYGWVPFDPTPSGSGRGFAESSWLWPGRFLFDAIQHRWNKWVLDYSLEDQLGLFRRTRGALSGRDLSREGSPSGTREGLPGRLLWWIAAVLLLGLFGFRVFLKPAPELPSARLFLRLRTAGRRAGMPAGALHSPLGLARHLESSRHPGAEPARFVVEAYLRDRFSGDRMEAEQVREMKGALAAAISALKRHPFR